MAQAHESFAVGTPEEQAAALEKDPRGFWQSVHQQSVKGLELIHGKMQQDLGKCLNFYTGHLKTIIGAQSRELTLFRELETHIRKQTLTQELWDEISALLDELRAAVQTSNQQVQQPADGSAAQNSSINH